MAGLMEQEMPRAETRLFGVFCRFSRARQHTGTITFWAWIVSIALHLVVLSVFGIVRFSQTESQDKPRPVPIAKVNRIKNLTQTAYIIPKPKIKNPAVTRPSKNKVGLLSESQIFGSAKPCSQDLGDFVKASASQINALSSNVNLTHRIEFFGNWTDARKICYLVDCSGSMKGMFGQVQTKLVESIKSLLPDQYFYIIFFGGDRLFELGKGQMIRATEQSKSAAYDFIESIKPAGQTNTLAALEKAVRVRDSIGAGPSVIYFLTDGFELTTEDTQGFLQNIKMLLKQFAPETEINAIGFWPQDNDRQMLRKIAELTGGEFVIIKD